MVSEVFRAVKRHLLFGISMLVIRCFLTECASLTQIFARSVFGISNYLGIVLIIIHSRRNVAN